MGQNYPTVAMRSFKVAPMFVAPSIIMMISLAICCFDLVPATNALLNCFTPNMFKMPKTGPPMASIYGQNSADRATWPQSQQGYYSQYPAYYAGGHGGGGGGGMKSLIQPKWRGSLFEPKKWMNWRMGANSNFYRPGFGYMAPIAPQLILPTQGTYSLNDQLNLPPFDSSNSNLYNPAIAQPTIPAINSYANNQQQAIDGWSIPYNQGSLRPIQGQQQLTNAYDSYSVSPGINQGGYNQPAKQQLSPNVDMYGTKGGASGSNKQQLNSTKKPKY